jgi:hypothetical protein
MNIGDSLWTGRQVERFDSRLSLISGYRAEKNEDGIETTTIARRGAWWTYSKAKGDTDTRYTLSSPGMNYFSRVVIMTLAGRLPQDFTEPYRLEGIRL